MRLTMLQHRIPHRLPVRTTRRTIVPGRVDALQRMSVEAEVDLENIP